MGKRDNRETEREVKVREGDRNNQSSQASHPLTSSPLHPHISDHDLYSIYYILPSLQQYRCPSLPH